MIPNPKAEQARSTATTINFQIGTDKFNPDTDGDGVDDRTEQTLGLSATNPDTDGDLRSDGLELTLPGFSATSADSDSDNGEAPTLTREGDEYVLVDDTQKVLLRVSGGPAPVPQDSAKPYTAGEKRYIYTYGELTGRPESGTPSSLDNLELHRYPDGDTDVCVEIEQDWIGASDATTTSPASATVPVKAQKPDTVQDTGGHARYHNNTGW